MLHREKILKLDNYRPILTTLIKYHFHIIVLVKIIYNKVKDVIKDVSFLENNICFALIQQLSEYLFKYIKIKLFFARNTRLQGNILNFIL